MKNILFSCFLVLILSISASGKYTLQSYLEFRDSHRDMNYEEL